MSEIYHHENELLRELESEFAGKVAAGLSHEQLRPLRSLITRIRTRLEAHTTLVPQSMQEHPALQRLREKLRRDSGHL